LDDKKDPKNITKIDDQLYNRLMNRNIVNYDNMLPKLRIKDSKAKSSPRENSKERERKYSPSRTNINFKSPEKIVMLHGRIETLPEMHGPETF